MGIKKTLSLVSIALITLLFINLFIPTVKGYNESAGMWKMLTEMTFLMILFIGSAIGSIVISGLYISGKMKNTLSGIVPASIYLTFTTFLHSALDNLGTKFGVGLYFGYILSILLLIVGLVNFFLKDSNDLNVAYNNNNNYNNYNNYNNQPPRPRGYDPNTGQPIY